MNFNKQVFLLLIVALFIVSWTATGQDKPIGYWRSLLPYDTASALATDGHTLFCASGEGFFTYDLSNGNQQTYGKVDGMSDEGTLYVGYDKATSSAIIVYSDGNIDIFKHNTFYNIPDFKITAVAGTKYVSALFVENGYAYLSTTNGVIVVDLAKHNISENYQFIINNQNLIIYSYTSDQNYFYAVTSYGLYRADKNSPDLQNFYIWQRLDSTTYITLSAKVGNQLYFAGTNSVGISKVYQLINDTLHAVLTLPGTQYQIQSIDGGLSNLFITTFCPNCYNGYVKILDVNNSIVDSINNAGKPRQTIQLLDSTIWIADAYYGIGKKNNNSPQYDFSPPGPTDPYAFDMFAYNKNLWIAHGGYSDGYQANGNSDGLSNFKNDNWTAFKRYQYAPFWDSMSDIVSVIVDEIDTTLYAASYGGGLFELHPNGNYKIYKQNSVLEPNLSGGGYQVMGLGLDQSDNLWVCTYGAYHELSVREKSTGNWHQFHTNFNTYIKYTGGPLTFDQAGDVWYIASFGGGVVGYSTNGTLGNTNDDTSCQLQEGVGSGNLPNSTVKSIAIDKTDNLWIGTTNGIAILYNASSCLSQHCDATIPIVQYDAYAGYLFAGETVHTIAVDGANRKWVGTDNGVWLLSPDASSIIYKFTKDNSPLPSNSIIKIAIDKITGDIYIGTTQGLVSYRSTATEGGTTNSNVLVFPDPVPSGYTGTIAIKGLVTDADVRITDIKGELVYKTTALGGQAIWNGLDYKGHRPESGVYLVFVSSPDGGQTYTGKFVFMK